MNDLITRLAIEAGLVRRGPSAENFQALAKAKHFAALVAEECAKEWEGCVYQSVGEDINIADAIRAKFGSKG